MSGRGKFRIEPFKHRVELDAQVSPQNNILFCQQIVNVKFFLLLASSLQPVSLRPPPAPSRIADTAAPHLPPRLTTHPRSTRKKRGRFSRMPSTKSTTATPAGSALRSSTGTSFLLFRHKNARTPAPRSRQAPGAPKDRLLPSLTSGFLCKISPPSDPHLTPHSPPLPPLSPPSLPVSYQKTKNLDPRSHPTRTEMPTTWCCTGTARRCTTGWWRR